MHKFITQKSFVFTEFREKMKKNHNNSKSIFASLISQTDSKSKLNGLVSDHTPYAPQNWYPINLYATSAYNYLTNWSQFRKLISSSTKLDVSLKSTDDIDQVIYSLTHNIHETAKLSSIQLSTLTNQTSLHLRVLKINHEKITSLIMVAYSLHSPPDKHTLCKINWLLNKLKSPIKTHKNYNYQKHPPSLTPANDSLSKSDKVSPQNQRNFSSSSLTWPFTCCLWPRKNYQIDSILDSTSTYIIKLLHSKALVPIKLLFYKILL